MEITSMLTNNTDVPSLPKPQESPAAKPTAPKPVKRKVPSSAKPEVRSKRVLAATKHRLAEQDAYTLTLSAFFAQGELTWQKEGLLCDLRQMLRISDEHHQREMQRIWANQTLCASARQQNNGKDNSERQKFVYEILPEVQAPSETESEPEDAASAVKKKKKKKKQKPSAPTLDAPASATAVTAPAAPLAAMQSPSGAPPLAEKPTKVLILKKAAKKVPPTDAGTATSAPATASIVPSIAPVPPQPSATAMAVPAVAAPQQTPAEMARLQLERQKLQEELARLAAEGEEEEDDEGTEGAPGASPDESEDE